MSEKPKPFDDGGPAFPLSDPGDGVNFGPHSNDGMSLRDWFAGQAMAGMIANQDFGQPKSDRFSGFASKVSGLCYELADAMLEARDRS